MNKIDELTKRVIELAGSTIADNSVKESHIKAAVKGFATDALNLFRNISETSLQQDDFDRRVKELCSRFGFTESSGKFY